MPPSLKRILTDLATRWCFRGTCGSLPRQPWNSACLFQFRCWDTCDPAAGAGFGCRFHGCACHLRFLVCKSESVLKSGTSRPPVRSPSVPGWLFWDFGFSREDSGIRGLVSAKSLAGIVTRRFLFFAFYHEKVQASRRPKRKIR